VNYCSCAHLTALHWQTATGDSKAAPDAAATALSANAAHAVRVRMAERELLLQVELCTQLCRF
jgi:hypothetical protein